MSDELLKLLANEIFAMRSDMKDLRSDISRVEEGLHAEITRVETGLRTDILKFESGLGDDLAKAESGLRDDLAGVEGGLRAVLLRVENEVLTTRSQMNFRFDTVETRLSHVEKDTTEIKSALHRIESNEPDDVIGILRQINTKLGPKQ
jgi:hypothetical protein